MMCNTFVPNKASNSGGKSVIADSGIRMRDTLELHYRVAYYVAQNALEEGCEPKTIRENTFKMEEFDRRSKHEPERPLKSRAAERLAKWLGIEDALAGRSQNPPRDLFIDDHASAWEAMRDQLTKPSMRESATSWTAACPSDALRDLDGDWLRNGTHD
jgi:hypothetical protein